MFVSNQGQIHNHFILIELVYHIGRAWVNLKVNWDLTLISYYNIIYIYFLGIIAYDGLLNQILCILMHHNM